MQENPLSHNKTLSTRHDKLVKMKKAAYPTAQLVVLGCDHEVYHLILPLYTNNNPQCTPSTFRWSCQTLKR